MGIALLVAILVCAAIYVNMLRCVEDRANCIACAVCATVALIVAVTPYLSEADDAVIQSRNLLVSHMLSLAFSLSAMYFKPGLFLDAFMPKGVICYVREHRNRGIANISMTVVRVSLLIGAGLLAIGAVRVLIWT